MMKTLATTAIAAVLAFVAVSPAQAWWSSTSNSASDREAAADLESQLLESFRQVPLPAITNWTERRAVQYLYELRDHPDFTTLSYLVVPMTGQFVLLCNSVGYGINASIQIANPIKHTDPGGDNFGNGAMPIPQAEPNGLFMPEGLAATYVMCIDEEAGELAPMYVEPEIIVSPFALDPALVINAPAE